MQFIRSNTIQLVKKYVLSYLLVWASLEDFSTGSGLHTNDKGILHSFVIFQNNILVVLSEKRLLSNKPSFRFESVGRLKDFCCLILWPSSNVFSSSVYSCFPSNQKVCINEILQKTWVSMTVWPSLAQHHWPPHPGWSLGFNGCTFGAQLKQLVLRLQAGG